MGQKLVQRKKDRGRKLKGAGPKEVAAVPGTRRMGGVTTARVAVPAMMGGKFVSELAVPDWRMYINVAMQCEPCVHFWTLVSSSSFAMLLER